MAPPPRFQGSADGGYRRENNRQISRGELDYMSDKDIDVALQTGQLNGILGRH